jgi:RNA polymerase sigma-70 factor (ECF subfamily)
VNVTKNSYRSEIEKLVPQLRQYARALVEDHRPDVADELVHDALAHALRAERGWMGDDVSIRLFGRLIVANRLRLHGEMGVQKSAPHNATQTETRPANSALHQSLPSSEATHHFGASPNRGLEGLSLGDREALLLVVLSRFDYPQVAQILGIPTGTAVTRVTHARDQLGHSLWSPPHHGGSTHRSDKRPRPAHLRLVKS